LLPWRPDRDRDGNSNIEEGLITVYLHRSSYTEGQISVALYGVRTEADNHHRGLFGNTEPSEAEGLVRSHEQEIRHAWCKHFSG